MDGQIITNDIIDEHSNNNILQLKYDKCEFLVLVVSNTAYLFFIIRSIARLRSTRDKNFWFLLIASTFAFMNNTNDIYYRIMAPIYYSIDCIHTFLRFFQFSALLNWIPISFYQVVRLYQITLNFYKKSYHRLILIVSILLSTLYAVCYLFNLSQFSGNNKRFGGCVVSNTNKYPHFIEITDILDSSFSLIVVIFTLFISLKNLKQYKLRHHKIKAVLDESTVIFIILLLSKVIIYSFIIANSSKPGGDIYWDGLSVIVFCCTYHLLNLKPRLNEKIENKKFNPKNNNRRILNLNNLNNLNNNNNNNNNNNQYTHSSTSSRSRLTMSMINRNSKGEINFPSLAKTKEMININSNNYNYNNGIIGQAYSNNHFIKMNLDIINNKNNVNNNSDNDDNNHKSNSNSDIFKDISVMNYSNINDMDNTSNFNCVSNSSYDKSKRSNSYITRYSNSYNLRYSMNSNFNPIMSSNSALQYKYKF